MDYRVRHVIALIREDPGRGHTLGSLSLAVNISASRLRHLFKKELGTTPTQYLKDIRMQVARELVETTALNTKQIMIRIGINDESHFLRDFKKTFGMTTVECRALYRSVPVEKSM